MATVTVFGSQITQCEYCGRQIGWLQSVHGRLYPVNLIAGGSSNGSTQRRAVTNDFHGCAEARGRRPMPPPRPVVAPRSDSRPAPRPTPLLDSVTASTVPNLVEFLTMPVTNPLTVEELVTLRRTVTMALDVYCEAYYRQRTATGVEPLTVINTYAREMEALIAAQVVAMSHFTVAARLAAQIPAPATPRPVSLDAVVDATLGQGQEPVEADNASGPEPIPGDWTANDDDIPF